MLASAARRLFSFGEGKSLRFASKAVRDANVFSQTMAALTDHGLRARSRMLQERARCGEDLSYLLPEAFSIVREATCRVLGMRHFDVQLLGGVILHQGRVAEMRTGEGKTLVALLAAYLNALSGKGVHVVTVNDYLARRDAEEAGQVLSFLGMTVGCVVPGMMDDDRRQAYGSDVTYVTNSEIGFDYLRDNMKQSRDAMVLRPLHFAIVDEVDSILIDEARMPLILSGEAPDQRMEVALAHEAVRELGPAHWDIDLKGRSVSLTESGLQRVEHALTRMLVMREGQLHDPINCWLVPYVHQAVRAAALFQVDRDYIVRDGKVLLVDQGTGRVLEGRRFSEGLHQALEAREGVEILPDNLTVASITYQNLFRLYPRLSGMTGTGMTEAEEFYETYGLEVVAIPTNRPVARVDHDDEVYLTAGDRDKAVALAVREARKRGQPVLIGTSSVERSEALSRTFARLAIPHSVLNARQHETEAMVIAQAGRSGAVTIATNMAGRGTDIRLGGSPDSLGAGAQRIQSAAAGQLQAEVRSAEECSEDAARVRAAGGLLVIGTERHESRRVDDQLRGRSGRQGDPGASRFMVSLEDELMARFGGGRMTKLMVAAGMKAGEPVAHPWVSRALRKAQERCEAIGFDLRRQLLKYDNVANRQRLAFYSHRLELVDGLAPGVSLMREDAVRRLLARFVPENSFAEQWDAEGLGSAIRELLDLDLPFRSWMDEEGVEGAVIEGRILDAAASREAALRAALPEAAMDSLERSIVLQAMDICWQEHLAELDRLRDGIGLRAYGQRDPLLEWQLAAAPMFDAMMTRSAERSVATLSRMVLVEPA